MSVRARYGALGLLLLVGAAVRIAFLLQWPRRLNVDEATVGLMGLRILSGEFPIFYEGLHYMGAPEAYVGAVVYALVGASPLTLRIAPFLFSNLLIILTFLVGRRMAGWPGGLCCGLLVAAGPPFLSLFGNFPLLGYIEVVVVGSLVLLLTLDLATDAAGGTRRTRRLLVLGLVGGLGWWINPMIFSYLAAAGFFVLLSPTVRMSRSLWALPLGFVLGSLPWWIFNLTHSFWSLAHFRWGVKGDPIANLKKAAPLLLEIGGVKGVGIRGVFADPVPFVSLAAGVVCLVLLGIVFVDLARRRPPEEAEARRRGIQLLLLFSLLHLVAYSLHGYARFGEQRYLFPLYSSIPVLVGLALLRLRGWSRLLSAAALLLLLLNNGLGFWSTFQAFEAARQRDWWKPEPVVELLESEGLTRAYANRWISLRLTFETRERIVVADPFFRRHHAHFKAVDAAPRAVYILTDRHEPTPAWFASRLQGIGANYRRKDFGDLSVFYDFQPPSAGTLVSIRPSSWRAEAMPRGSDLMRAFDREVDTAWFSEEFLRPGMWYQLDLGATIPVGGITVLPVRPRFGIPRGYRIELSPDGATWETVASAPAPTVTLRWIDGQPRMDRSGDVVSRFETRPVRYIRITQTGQNRREWWAIAEIFVYGSSSSPAPGQHQEASAHLREGIWFEKRGQWGPALTAYEQAVRLDPELEEAHRRIVRVFRYARLPLEGIDRYRRGLVFERLGLWVRAAREYELLLEQVPEHSEHSDLLSRLVEIYRRQGQAGRARHFERRLREQFVPPTRADVRFGGSARLLGYGLAPAEPMAGQLVELSYYWQALRPMAEDFAVFVHFVLDGKIRFLQDHAPVHGRYPTSRWREGERIRERYRVRLPPELPSGEYEIRVGLWNPRTGKRLRAQSTSLPTVRDEVRVTTVRVRPPR